MGNPAAIKKIIPSACRPDGTSGPADAPIRQSAGGFRAKIHANAGPGLVFKRANPGAGAFRLTRMLDLLVAR
jgi:hypothetical protein